jgi:hypothetical protein
MSSSPTCRPRGRTGAASGTPNGYRADLRREPPQGEDHRPARAADNTPALTFAVLDRTAGSWCDITYTTGECPADADDPPRTWPCRSTSSSAAPRRIRRRPTSPTGTGVAVRQPRDAIWEGARGSELFRFSSLGYQPSLRWQRQAWSSTMGLLTRMRRLDSYRRRHGSGPASDARTGAIPRWVVAIPHTE